jgi:hypothetical protein
MEYLGLFLPKFIVYDILSFIPKFDVSSTTLEYYKLYNKFKKTIKNSMNLSDCEISDIIKDLETFDFSRRTCYCFENDNLHLTMYHENNSKIDYILIFY